MRLFTIFLPALAAALFVSSSQAQLGKGSSKSSARSRAEDRAAEAVTEAAERLLVARKQAEDERVKLDREAATQAILAAKAAAAAQDPTAGMLSAAESILTNRAQESLQAAMNNVSSEGQARLKAGDEVTVDSTRSPRDVPGSQVAQAAPTPDPVPVASPPSAGSPQPEPLKPATLESDRAKQERVVIVCDGAAFFDPKNSIGIFTDNVRVYHPDFYIEGDELEIHMKKDANLDLSGSGAEEAEAVVPLVTDLGAPSEGTTPIDESTDATTTSPQQSSSIDFVIVRGPMVLIEKQTENGDIQVGKCKKATYDADSGELLMSGLPQVQRGPQLQIATDPNTTMTILPSGAFRSNGPSKTDILRGKDANVKSKTLRVPPGE